MIDTHLHIWDIDKVQYSWLTPDLKLLYRNYQVQDIKQEAHSAGVNQFILVQAANNFEETAFLLEQYSKHAQVAGICGWLPLKHPDLVNQLLDIDEVRVGVRSTRHLIHVESDVQWLLQPSVLKSLTILAERGIPYEVVGSYAEHVVAALKAASLVETTFVIDHLGNPPLASKSKLKEWKAIMLEAASAGFYAKISGLGTNMPDPARWDMSLLAKVLEFTLEAFGTEKCVLGSDWPVALQSIDYSATLTSYIGVLNPMIGEVNLDKIKTTNATRLYKIQCL